MQLHGENGAGNQKSLAIGKEGRQLKERSGTKTVQRNGGERTKDPEEGSTEDPMGSQEEDACAIAISSDKNPLPTAKWSLVFSQLIQQGKEPNLVSCLLEGKVVKDRFVRAFQV